MNCESSFTSLVHIIYIYIFIFISNNNMCMFVGKHVLYMVLHDNTCNLQAPTVFHSCHSGRDYSKQGVSSLNSA